MTSSASATPLFRSIVVWVTAPTRRATRRLACRRPMPTTFLARFRLAQGHADRPADQSDPHNGDRIPLFHGIFRVGGDAGRQREHEVAHCTKSPPVWSGGSNRAQYT